MANPVQMQPSGTVGQPINNDHYVAAMNVQLQILSEMQQINELNRKIHGQPPLKSKELWNFLLQFFGVFAALCFGIFAILAWKAADLANTMASSATDLASSANALAASANSMASAGNGVAAAARTDAAVANMLAIWAKCEATPIETGTAVQSTVGNPCDGVLSAMSQGYTFYNLAERYFSLLPHDDVSSATSSTAPPTNDATATTTSVPNDATSTSAPNAGASSPANSGLIAGAVIGGIAGLALLFGVMYLPYQTYRAKLRRAQELASLRDRDEKGGGKNA